MFWGSHLTRNCFRVVIPTKEESGLSRRDSSFVGMTTCEPKTYLDVLPLKLKWIPLKSEIRNLKSSFARRRLHLKSKMKKRALLVMAKRPFPGHTKTRLCPPFSPEEAATLYECFLRDALDIVRAVPNVTPFIAYSPSEEGEYFKKLAPDFELIPQIGANLGERLDFVLSHTLAAGFEQVAAINSDSPTLPPAYLAQAFAHLDNEAIDVVFGPCEDGGYYLIGWKQPHPRLVREIQMSTSHVLQDTLDIARQEKLQIALLPTWYDVDTIADLERIKAEMGEKRVEFGRHTHDFWTQ